MDEGDQANLSQQFCLRQTYIRPQIGLQLVTKYLLNLKSFFGISAVIPSQRFGFGLLLENFSEPLEDNVSSSNLHPDMEQRIAQTYWSIYRFLQSSWPFRARSTPVSLDM